MFDPSAPHIIILLVVVLLLFGAGRLPGAAEALGKSMRVFKRETGKLHEDDAKPVPPAGLITAQAAPARPALSPVPQPAATAPAAAQAASTQPVGAQDASAQLASTEAQLADLQRQLAELRDHAAVPASVPGRPAL